MIIIGERLNSSRKPVLRALQERNSNFLIKEALKQEEKGANFIDLNTSALLSEELETLKWIIPFLQEELTVPLSIDTPNPEAMKVGLKIHRGKAILNSLSAEPQKIRGLLPLIKEYHPFIIVLCLDDKGLPNSPEEELSIASRMVNLLEKEGVDLEDVLIDPLVRPVGVDHNAGLLFLQSLQKIKKNIPQVKTVAGLSNVSFGLPNRRLINRTFLVLALQAGLDAAILDPLDKNLAASIHSAEALLGNDPSLKNYLRAAKSGRL